MKRCNACNYSTNFRQHFAKHLKSTKHKNNVVFIDIADDIENIFSDEVEEEMYSNTKKRPIDEFPEFSEATQYLKKLKGNNTDPKDIQ